MKKYILFLIPVMVLFFKSVTLASETAPNGEEYNYHYSYVAVYSWNNQRVVADIWTDGKWASFGSDSGGVLYVCPDGTFVTPTTGTLNYSGDNYYRNGNPNSDEYYRNYVSFGGSVGNQTYYGTSSPIVTSNIENFASRELAETYLLEQDIDWDNIMYDPSIPTPIFSVYYNDDSSTLPRFNADIELKNASEDLYVYVTMDNSTPISYGIAYDGNIYNVAYHKFPTRVLVSMESLTTSESLTMALLSGIVSSGWRSDINTILDSDVEVSAVSDGAYWTASSAGFIAKKTQLLNLRKMALFYGNSNTISVQYFRIDEGNVYAGEIKSWNNLNGGVFTMTVPKYYQPHAPANGFEVITIDRPLETANPLTTIPENQYGERTGYDININVNSNVPNYPDYPTIATYNLDNILVSTIDNARHLGNFFSQVSAFCVATFAWIPNEVWQIVALGFALSIVVMFVKIL